MLTKQFNYHLLKFLIAQSPIFPRDHSRLLVLKRENCHSALPSRLGSLAETDDAESINNIDSCLLRNDIIIHDRFFNLGKYLKKGDVVVFNNSKVIPARLIDDRGKEIFLLHSLNKDDSRWFCLARYKGQSSVKFAGSSLVGNLTGGDYEKIIRFNLRGREFWQEVEKIGEVPTPPYIKKYKKYAKTKKDYYQTIFAREKGSVAAPTAGFHFTQKLIKKLKKQGVEFVFITLHVGLGTFAPIRAERVEEHQMHSEWFELNKKTADILSEAKRDGRRIVAVGTTATRVLESCVVTPPSPANIPNYYLLKPQSGETKIFIYPGYKFKFVDALITNFHLPHSTPLLLASAFVGNGVQALACGKQTKVWAPNIGVRILLEAYREAIKNNYRFYSFGDAMFIV